jgi:glycine/D-amino acid oxidase-like deaminating enzyme
VVDKRSIGLGSTCASTSLLQYEIDTALHELVNKRGYKDAVRAYTLCAAAIDDLLGIAKKIKFSDIQPQKSLYYAAAKKDTAFLKREFDIRKANNFGVQWLEEKDIARHYGFTAPAAILSEQAAQTDAYAFTHALFQYGINKGLSVYDRTDISSIKKRGKGFTLAVAGGYAISAKKIIYATGYEVVELIDKKIVDLKSTYAFVSEHQQAMDSRWNKDALIWNTADPYLYMRTTTDNRIIVGGRDEDFVNPVRRDKLIKKKTSQLVNDFHKIYPGSKMQPAFSWAGTFGSTKDGLPFIGKYSKQPGCFFSLGFGGNGITFSVIAARIITDLIKGKANKDAPIFSFARV